MNIFSMINKAKERHAEKMHRKSVNRLYEETKEMELKAKREEEKAQLSKLKLEEMQKYDKAKNINSKVQKPNVLMQFGQGLSKHLDKQKKKNNNSKNIGVPLSSGSKGINTGVTNGMFDMGMNKPDYGIGNSSSSPFSDSPLRKKR